MDARVWCKTEDEGTEMFELKIFSLVLCAYMWHCWLLRWNTEAVPIFLSGDETASRTSDLKNRSRSSEFEKNSLSEESHESFWDEKI